MNEMVDTLEVYEVVTSGHRRLSVSGQRIGDFAVRTIDRPGALACPGEADVILRAGTAVVDHLPTGYCVGFNITPELALFFADEFAQHLDGLAGADDMASALPRLMPWIKAQLPPTKPESRVTYRQWLRQQQPAAAQP